MKTKYYAFYPRRFGNEYTVIRISSPEEEKRLMDWYDNLRSDPANRSIERVTVKQLRTMSSNERQVRKHNPAFSGYCSPWAPKTVDEFLTPEF